MSKEILAIPCPKCGIDKIYKSKKNYLRCKNKLCRSCSNSVKVGGVGNVKPINGYKICTKCIKSLPISEFYYYKTQNRYHSLCNVCKKETFKMYSKTIGRFKKYNIDEIKFNELLLLQNNKCIICDKEDKLYIDHCHKTNKIRGLLCQKCNSALGLFDENINNLEKAIKYLRENNNE